MPQFTSAQAELNPAESMGRLCNAFPPYNHLPNAPLGSMNCHNLHTFHKTLHVQRPLFDIAPRPSSAKRWCIDEAWHQSVHGTELPRLPALFGFRNAPQALSAVAPATAFRVETENPVIVSTDDCSLTLPACSR
jgi:hypothetical protein